MKKLRVIKLNIFWKTFLITTVMLMGITFISFTLIYLFLPGFYQNYEIDTYNKMVNTRMVELESTENFYDEVNILNEIFSSSNTTFTLLDSDGNVLLENYVITNQSVVHREEEGSMSHFLYQEDEFHFEVDNQLDIIEVDDNFLPIMGFGMTTFDFDYTSLILTYEYINGLGNGRKLEVTIPLSPLADAQVVIMRMYPFAVLLSIIFALIVAFIFSRWIANPIKRIQAATSKMSRLEPNVTIAVKSQDEIGILSNDISRVYEQLYGTIVTLEQEISRYSDAENKKIEFLQSVSHEMKTPLASANALLEGIIYEVSPYYDNPKKYLLECRDFLQNTIKLTKESLNLSEQYKKPEALYNLADLIKEASNLYGVIFMVKQLSYHEDVPGNISIRTKEHLLLKVLSNLFSNAASYTSEGGQVRVTYDAGVLTIFNTCDPLPQERVDEIFKPLMTQNAAEHSTGLGLFIVKQLLRQLQIKFTFSASADGKGMEFKLWLPIVDE